MNSCNSMMWSNFYALGSARRQWVSALSECLFAAMMFELIYNQSTSIGRPIPDYELATLTEYRSRIALYRADPGTLIAHQDHAWITVWYVVPLSTFLFFCSYFFLHITTRLTRNTPFTGTTMKSQTTPGKEAPQTLTTRDRQGVNSARRAHASRIARTQLSVHTTSGCPSVRLLLTIACASGETSRLDNFWSVSLSSGPPSPRFCGFIWL